MEQKVGWRKNVVMNLCPLTWCTRRRSAPRRWCSSPFFSLNTRSLGCSAEQKTQFMSSCSQSTWSQNFSKWEVQSQLSGRVDVVFSTPNTSGPKVLSFTTNLRSREGGREGGLKKAWDPIHKEISTESQLLVFFLHNCGTFPGQPFLPKFHICPGQLINHGFGHKGPVLRCRCGRVRGGGVTSVDMEVHWPWLAPHRNRFCSW